MTSNLGGGDQTRKYSKSVNGKDNYHVTFTKENRTKNRKNMIPTPCPFQKFTLSLFLVVLVFYLYVKNENWENDTKNCSSIIATSSWKIFISLISSYLFHTFDRLCFLFLFLVIMVFYLYAKNENWENDTKNSLSIMATSRWKIFISLISSYLFHKFDRFCFCFLILCWKVLIIS